jgi:hypothetical protein
MDYKIIILLSIVTFFIGYHISTLIRKLSDKAIDDEDAKKVISIYNEILVNIYSNNTKFLSRINKSVSIETEISEGVVNIVYLMDRDDIAIFKGEACIYSSTLVDRDIIDEMIVSIKIYHRKDIDDIINIFGFVFSKKYFETRFKVNVDDITRNLNIALNKTVEDVSGLDKIKKDNSVMYDIDEILDKISLVGISNLTTLEKKFLDNYNGQ